MKFLWGILAFLNTVLLMWLVLRLPAPDGTPKLTYDQFISISLTVMTVILGVIALLMAYLAFEGKNQIIERAMQVAIEQFQKAKPELFIQLKKETEGKFAAYIQEQSDELYRDFAVTKGEQAVKFNVDQIPDDLKEVKK